MSMLLAEDLELLDGGRALHVGGDEERLVPFLGQVARELGRGRRLSRALEADHHDAGRLASVRPDHGLALVGHQGDQLVVADLDELIRGAHLVQLAGRLHAGANDLAERLLFDAREERLDDAELDVRLEQRQADFAQRRLDVGVGQLGQTCQTVACLPEPLGKCIEHRGFPERGRRLTTVKCSLVWARRRVAGPCRF